MSKYYLTCGATQWIVQAESARQAAMRLLDELLAEHIWIYDDSDLSDQDRRDHLVIESLLHLPTEIHVSERGLGRCDAGTFGVPDLLDEWDRLMTAVSRLFVAAGLAPRRVLPQATAAGHVASERIRLPR
jgi:hypothetical protein